MKNTFLKISIILSVISILITITINFQISKAYSNSHGKGRALFGLTELLEFGYQYYITIIGIISLIFAIFSLKKKEKVIGIFLSLTAISMVFARIWRLFVFI